MSIAAGIRYKGGVLLCADTEQSAWTHTIHQSKIRRWRCRGGVVVMAYAGHSAFSISAIEKCEQTVKDCEPEALLEEIEGTLEEEYRRHVLSHPDHASDGTLPYRILVGLWRPGQKAELFVTTQTAMHSVDGYECIGSGDYLGHYLVRPHFARSLEERKALSLAAAMLAGVKGYVEGVGGLSCFMALRDDGMVADVISMNDEHIAPRISIEWLEYSAQGYQWSSRELLLKAADLTLSEEHFEGNLGLFCQQVRELRARWIAGTTGHDSMVFLPVHTKPEEPPNQPPTKADP